MQREEMKAESGNARAYFLHQVQVLVDADQALASSLTLLTAEFNDNVAFVATELLALATADSALSSAITQVEAEVDDVSAGGFFAMKVQIAPAGWDISLAMVARATAGGVNLEAGQWIFIKSDGTTGIAHKANNYYLLNDTGGIVSSPFNVIGGVVYMTNVRISGSLMLDETVNTNVLMANSVFGGVSATQVSTVGAGSGIVGVYYAVAYGTVKVSFTGAQARPSSGASNFGLFYTRLLRNGVVIKQLPYFYDDNFSQPLTVEATDTPGPGTHYYSSDTYVADGPGLFNVEAGGEIIVENFKR